MGLVKFEVDIPNFEKELSISITIRRDGEVFYSTSSPSMGNIDNVTKKESNIPSWSNGVLSEPDKIVEDHKIIEEATKETTTKRKKVETKSKQSEEPILSTPKKRGNFMNVEI